MSLRINKTLSSGGAEPPPFFAEKRKKMRENIQFAAPCLLGLESLVAAELREMGAEDVRAENGRVLFAGDEAILARANICSRYAERIQIVLGAFPARSFEELFEGTKALPWEEWIGKFDTFPVKGYCLNSELHSVSDCQAIVKKAVVERLKSVHHVSWFEESGPIHQIQFSIMKNQATLLLDTSGVGLHKRGYRPAAVAAPIKETLAAAMVNLARLRENHTLYDPFCGSGTILIEGAMQALNIAPGLGRSFSAQRWEQSDEATWETEFYRARDMIKRDSNFMAYGSDIDEEALRLAEINAKRAGVDKHISLQIRDAADFEPVTERGTVICNPPYGERLLSVSECEQIYKNIGNKFDKRRGWGYYIISPSEEFETFFGRKADKRRKLYNGMIKCWLFMYYK